MTLAALFAMTAGAWADGTLQVTEIKASDISAWDGDNTTLSAADLPGFKAMTFDEAKAWADAPASGSVILIYAFDGNDAKYVHFYDGEYIESYSQSILRDMIYNALGSTATFYTSGASSEPSAQTVDVTPVTGTTNQWTLTMPAGNVELQVEYDPWKVTLQTNNDQWGTVEAVTGGGVKEFTVPETWGSDNTTFSAADLPSDFAEVTDEVAEAIPAPSSEGNVMLFYGFNGTKAKAIVYSLGTIYRQGEQEITRHTIYSSANGYGYKICYTTAGDVTANADGTYSVVPGKSITLKATPKDGYRLAGWYKVDGNDVAALTEADGAVADAEAGTLTLTPEADVTIRAEFAALTYTVTFAEGVNPEPPAEPEWSASPAADVKKGETVTVTYTGTKKVIGVKAEKKAAALLTLSVCGETIYYAEGETWAEAIQNHPTENQGWEIFDGDVTHENLGYLFQNDDFVPGTAKIDPNASYSNGSI